MTILITVLVGVLTTTGVYLVLQRNLIRVFFGLVLLSHAVNLLLLAMGRVARAAPPVHPLADAAANPLPQALVLTAVVISFGLTAFFLVLVLRSYGHFGTVDAGVTEREGTT